MPGLASCNEGPGGDSGPRGRRSVPVIAHFAVSIPASEQDRLAGIATSLLHDEPALSSTSFFGALVEAGLSEAPAVLIGDSREIALASERVAQSYEYRISHLAAEGDVLLLGGSRNTAFEHYREHVLGLGAIDVVALPPERFGELTPLASRCLSETQALNRIAAKARKAGGLSIVPHIGSGSAWRLAAAIAERSGAPVWVAASPPRLTRRVNDKVWFAHRVNEVLGRRARPAFHAAFGPAALAAHVLRLARQSERIVIKVPDSAGSAGNLSLSAATIQSYSPAALGAHLASALNEIGWKELYPLLVEIWDSPALASPSVQTWIPDRRAGAPVLEGVFEQVLAGPKGTFIGSVPATFPVRWEGLIVEEALRLATLFQHLGYFGRCSFDAVIAGSDYADAELHWLECNGRWGGVSVPMTLANRLTGNWSRGAFVVVQLTNLHFPQHDFSKALELLDGRLYRAGQSSEGIVFMSPFGIERGSGVNLMAIATTFERAKTLAEQATGLATAQ